MIKKLLPSKAVTELEQQKSLVALELSEIREISDLIFGRIEKKLRVLEALETSVDKKIASLERMIQRAEAFRAPGAGMNRQHEIFALRKRGLKTEEIAEVLDMPVGEAELILELNAQKG